MRATDSAKINTNTPSVSSSASSTVRQMIQDVGSTPHYRRIQRAHAFSELVSTSLFQLGADSLIPCKITQTIISGQGLFDSRRKPRERFAHGVQASISLIELILMSILYFNETSCQKKTTDLCKTLVLFNILYKALLTLSFGAGEIARDKYQAGKEIPEPISRSTSHNSLFSPNNPTVNDQSSSTREEKQDAYEML